MGKPVCNISLVLVLILVIPKSWTNLSEAGTIVKNLPGFPGPLPFELETGYIGVDESEDVQLFYYFTKSESSPESDPIVVWSTGGPGCSAISALAYGFGPVHFEPFQYDGSLPKLMLNPYSWTKVASIIFLDQPVGAGFSYARTAKAFHSSDLQVSHQIHEFLRKWLLDHPEFISNPFYVAGDSYLGIIVPVVTQLISDGNEAGLEPKINLKGYILGNPKTSPDDGNYKVPKAHALSLISNQLYQALKVNCQGQYQTVDLSNTLCLQYLQTYDQLLTGINTHNILEKNCSHSFTETNERPDGRRRSTIDIFPQKIKEPTPIKCREEGDTLVTYWANDRSVQEALHVREGTICEWLKCNPGVSYTKTISTVVPYHANLSIKGYRSLVYSGDHDMLIPDIGTQAWIEILNYRIVDDWRRWMVGGQIAGYTRTYANKMTFATVKGAGHSAIEYKHEESLAMLKRWLSSQPL